MALPASAFATHNILKKSRENESKGKNNQLNRNASTPVQASKLFCEIAIDLGFIDDPVAKSVLDEQKVDIATGQHKPIGEYLFRKGHLTKNQIGQVLKMQDKITG